MSRYGYVYHICRVSDKYNFKKGYIGVSRNPIKRWSNGYQENPHLQNAFSCYDDIVKYVFYFGTMKECLNRELRLRPKMNMGWNIAKGGGLPPRPPKGVWLGGRRKVWIVSDEARFNMSLAQSRRSDDLSQRMKGSKNPNYGKYGKNRIGFKGWYVTPLGKFDTREKAARAHGVSTMVITRRCVTENKKVLKRCRWVSLDDVGKTWYDIGYSFINLNEIGEKDA